MPFRATNSNLLHFTDGPLSLGVQPTGAQVLGLSGGAVRGVDAATLLGSTFQPLDSDLTAIAALSTTAFGRALLTLTDAAAQRAGARSGIAVVDPSSPYTVAAGVREIIFTAGTAKTVNLIALSDLTDGEIIWIFNQSASTVSFTVDPPTGATLNGGADGASAAFSVAARGVLGVQRLSSGTWGSVQLGSLNPIGVEAYVSGGVLYAVAVTLDSAGVPVQLSAPVAMTAEGTSYSESISGTNITLTGPLVGNTGAIQSNSRRYYVALSDLGITLSTTNTRWATLHGMCASLSDNSEARAGTVDLGCFLGVGSTTALCGVSVYRPSTGSTYGVNHWQASATTFTSVFTSAAVRGFHSRHGWPNDAGVLQTAALDSAGVYLGSQTASGAALSASEPTHFVVYIRSTASASGAVFGNPRFMAIFGVQTTLL